MSSLDAVIKSEIARIARKQLRVDIAPLQKSSARYRSEIASLRRRIDALERQARAQSRGRSATAKDAGNVDDGATAHRFSAKGLASHRKRLGLSASQLARLLGVSALSVYHWESGKARPRPKQIEAIAHIRTLGRREAAARLQAMESAKPRKEARAAVSRARGRTA